MDIIQLNRSITQAQEEAYVAQQEAEEAVDRLAALRGQRIATLRSIALDIGLEHEQLVTFSDGRQLVGTWGYGSGKDLTHCIGAVAGFFRTHDGALVRIELADLHFVERHES